MEKRNIVLEQKGNYVIPYTGKVLVHTVQFVQRSYSINDMVTLVLLIKSTPQCGPVSLGNLQRTEKTGPH